MSTRTCFKANLPMGLANMYCNYCYRLEPYKVKHFSVPVYCLQLTLSNKATLVEIKPEVCSYNSELQQQVPELCRRYVARKIKHIFIFAL